MSEFRLSPDDQKRVAEAVARDCIAGAVKLLNDALPFARVCGQTLARDIGDALHALAGERPQERAPSVVVGLPRTS